MVRQGLSNPGGPAWCLRLLWARVVLAAPVSLQRCGAICSLALMVGTVAVIATGCESRATMMYRRAEEFFARGQYQLAADEYKRVAQTYTHSDVADEALYKLAHLYAVHLGNPRAAFVEYNRLAATYPDSPFAPSALLAAARIAATKLHAPDLARQALTQLEARYPARTDLIVRARLELARAYLRAGKFTLAASEARKIWSGEGMRAEHAAAAGLVLADALARSSEKSAPDPAAILEQVATKYPDTLAAEEARKRLGLLYYRRKKEEAQRKRVQLRRESRWLADLGSFGSHAWPPFTMLDATRVLLAYQGVQVSLASLAAASGTALMPVLRPGESIPRLWQREPLAALIESYGLSASVWNASSPEEAWEVARRAISGGRPVLIAYSTAYPWALIGGWNAERQQVGLLLPGRRTLKTVALKDFLRRWRPAAELVTYVPFAPGRYYLLAASGELSEPPGSPVNPLEVFLSAVRESPLADQPASVAREVARQLQECSSGDGCPPQLISWAKRSLPAWAEARRVLSDFLRPSYPSVADQAAHIADVLGALRTAILAVEQSPAPSRELQAASSYADRLAAEEDNLLQSLRRLQAGGEEGSG